MLGLAGIDGLAGGPIELFKSTAGTVSHQSRWLITNKEQRHRGQLSREVMADDSNAKAL